MSMSTKLPSVLQKPNGNSISMERALEQIKSIIEDTIAFHGENAPNNEVDRMNASVDDLNTMLTSIDRG